MKIHLACAAIFFALIPPADAQTWVQQTIGTTETLYSTYFQNDSTGWIAADNGLIFKTTNGGTTWSQQASLTGNQTFSITFTDANTGWVVGVGANGGTIFKTTNGGANWTAQTSGVQDVLRSAFFLNSNTGWSVGYNAGSGLAHIINTTNGGTTWNTQLTIGSGQNELDAVQFINADTGWVVGYATAYQGDVVFKTTDGGATWSHLSLGTFNHSKSLFFLNATTGWMADAGGNIRKTTDGGATWQSQNSGLANAQFFGIRFWDANSGLVFGSYQNGSNYGVILRTDDGGTSWVSTPTKYAQHSVSISNNAWSVGELGTVYNFTNNSPVYNLTYFPDTSVFGTGTAITPNVPANGGAATPLTYSVTPTLPAGLTLNSSTGIISGTPTAATAAANYIITATNTYGSGKDTLNLTILQTPANLSYGSNPAVYYAGGAITANAPSVTGPVTHYSITPTLPAGLAMDTITGIISGTPTVVSAATNYTVRAYNGSVSAAMTLSIQVVSAPFGLSYGSNPVVYGINVAITANNPTVSGSTPITYSVTPALPSGLTLNTGTGVITGTPTVGGSATNYTVTATNTYGSTTATLNITVLAAPSNLSYSASPAAYKVGTAIASNTPSVTGTVTRYSVNPALPSGLRLDSNTGVISGTPTLPVAVANYTVTASSVAGSTMATLSIIVRLAPANLAYAVNPAVYAAGTAITANAPSVQGTSPLAYSVTPALPTGLVLDSSSGIISGTPRGGVASTAYTITVSNPAGSAIVTLNLTVNGPAAISEFTLENLNLNSNQTLHFTLARRTHVEITLFDSRGKIQENLLDADWEAGHYTFPLPKSDLHGPQYLLEFRAGEFHRTVQLNSSL